jgi:hypothetical protein
MMYGGLDRSDSLSRALDDSLRRRARTARAAVEAGCLSGPALRELVESVPFVERDAWVDELLGIDLPPPDMPDLPRGAVPYLPCGVEEILATVREVPLCADDTLVDLGSGLGRVVLLGHLLSGARAVGVELQSHLVAGAAQRAADLHLTGVSFVHANAADIELDGSVFFLYAPCNGAMLTRVIARIENVARRRPIVVAAVGLELHDVPWLMRRPTSSRALTLYDG